MSLKIKKIAVWLAAALLLPSVFVFTGCGRVEDEPIGGQPPRAADEEGAIFPERARKTDGQLYTLGGVQYPASLWGEPGYEFDPSLDPSGSGTGGVKAFFMDSPIQYNGKPTKIMGYIGFPEGAGAGDKVPGIVLVHGGLGTAYPDWVKQWNDFGWAAVSIDTEGGQSLPGNTMNSGLHDERNKYDGGAADPAYTAGPANNGFYISSVAEIADSWMYHATSAVILANSLLRADPRVDEDKVGITGISWGGVVTGILIGYDDRYAFAMPVYGSVGLNGSSAQFNSFPNVLARETWDTLKPLMVSEMPVLWLNGNKDFAFGLDATSKCFGASKNGFLTVKNNLTHGQKQGAEPSELAAFADAAVGRGDQAVKITKAPSKGEPKFTYRAGPGVTVNSAKLYYSADAALSPSSTWREIPVALPASGQAVDLTVPETARRYYVNITYNQYLTASCPLTEVR
jgi:dienelactone hydrolase